MQMADGSTAPQRALPKLSELQLVPDQLTKRGHELHGQRSREQRFEPVLHRAPRLRLLGGGDGDWWWPAGARLGRHWRSLSAGSPRDMRAGAVIGADHHDRHHRHHHQHHHHHHHYYPQPIWQPQQQQHWQLPPQSSACTCRPSRRHDSHSAIAAAADASCGSSVHTAQFHHERRLLKINAHRRRPPSPLTPATTTHTHTHNCKHTHSTQAHPHTPTHTHTCDGSGTL